MSGVVFANCRDARTGDFSGSSNAIVELETVDRLLGNCVPIKALR